MFFGLSLKMVKSGGALETMTSITWGGKRAMLGNFIDITERKQAEERLEQAAQEWRITFDSITDIISIHDKDNRIVRVNKAMADLLKKTPQELIGKFCHEVMHGTKEPPANCPHLRTLKSGKPAAIRNVIIRILKPISMNRLHLCLMKKEKYRVLLLLPGM